MKLFTNLLVVSAMAAGVAQAAVTVSIKNFTSTTVGVPIVTAAGAAVPTNTIFAHAGIFSAGAPNFSTSTALTLLAAFTPIDATGVSNPTFTGLFTGNDMTSGAYPAGFSGASSYILVSNNASLALSTLVAVYSTGSTFTPVDGAGNANVALNGTVLANWVFGTPTTITTQPSLGGSNYGTTGIQLAAAAVPEPSSILLGAIGALGLLRRRRI